MKSTGIVRKVDNVGRYVLPSELREVLNIKIGDNLECFVSGANIVLRKYQAQNSCIFCGEMHNTIEYKDKFICKECLKELKKQSS